MKPHVHAKIRSIRRPNSRQIRISIVATLFSTAAIVAASDTCSGTADLHPVRSSQFESPSIQENSSELAPIIRLASDSDRLIVLAVCGDLSRPPCQMFRDRLLGNEAFFRGLGQDAIVVLLEENEEMDERTRISDTGAITTILDFYDIRGVPALVLLDEQGRPVAKLLGYSGESNEHMMREFEKMVEVKQSVDALWDRASGAYGSDRAELLHQSLQLLPADWVMRHYRDIVQEIIALDHDNQARLRIEYELRLLSHEASEDSLDASIVKANELLDRVQMGTEQRQKVQYVKASLLYGVDRLKSLDTFREAIDVQPDSELAERIESVIKRAFEACELETQ